MTVIEIEAKMRLLDIEPLLERLKAMAAVRLATLLEQNTYYDTPGHQLRAADQGLRVRVETDLDTGQVAVMMTHKGPRCHDQLKSRPETQLQVASADAAQRMLIALGYQPMLSFEKRRTHWQCQDCFVDIDELPYLGTYVEIEGPNDAAVLAMREQLHLGHLPLISANYLSLLGSYLTENRIDARNIRFDSLIQQAAD